MTFDADVWRTHPYTYRRYLFMLKPTVVLSAQVDAPVALTYPFNSFNIKNVTGSTSDVKPGMTLVAGQTAGSDNLGRQRVRQAISGSTVYVGRTSQGINDGELYLLDGDYIQILDLHQVWAKIPYIDDDGISYKDETLVGDFGMYQPPVANAGVGYAGFVDPTTEVATVEFDGSNSFAVSYGQTISYYDWDVADGTITVGNANSAQITVEFPAGFRYVYLTVYDTIGRGHTCSVPVFAADQDTNRPIMDFDVTEDSIRSDGTTMSFTIKEAIDKDDYPEGTLVIYWEEEQYGSEENFELTGLTNRTHVKFVGWANGEQIAVQASEKGNVDETQIRCVNTAGRLQSLPGFPQIVDYDNDSTDWARLAYLTVDRYVWYILYWHSTALEVSDFTWSADAESYHVPGLESSGTSLWEQASQFAMAKVHKLTCDRRGRLFVVGYPLDQPSEDRTSTIAVDLASADWKNFRFSRQRPPRVYWLEGSAIQTGTDPDTITAFKCISPGLSPGQGVSPSSFGNQLVVDQAELNERTGHDYARLNSPWGDFTIDLMHCGDAGVEPAYMEWVTFTFSTPVNKRRWSMMMQRCLPVEITIQHSNDAKMTKQITMRFTPETYGVPAVTRVIEETAQPEYDSPVIAFPSSSIEPPTAPEPDWDEETNFAASPGVYIACTALVARTRNMTSGTPSYEVLFRITDAPFSTYDQDTITDFELDSWDPKNAAYMTTWQSDGGNFRPYLWYVTNLNGTAGTQVITLLCDPVTEFVGSIPSFNHTTWKTGGTVKSSININGGVYWFIGWQQFGTDQRYVVWRPGRTAAFQAKEVGVTNAASQPVGVIGHHAMSPSTLTLYFSGGLEDYYRAQRSPDGLATWANIGMAFYPEDICMPYEDNPNDNIVYLGSSYPQFDVGLFRRNEDGSLDTIQPVSDDDSQHCGVWGYLGIHAYTQNRLYMAIMARDEGAHYHFFTSIDGGDIWLERNLPAADAYQRVGGWPYDEDIMLLFGPGTHFYWTQNLFSASKTGVTWNDFTGTWVTDTGLALASTDTKRIIPVWVK